MRKAVLSIFGNVYKQQEMEIDPALSEIDSKYDFTFNMFKEKQLTAIKSIIENKDTIDQCLQTFPKLILLLVPKFTYPECMANLKLPVDTSYRESSPGVNIAKRNITTGLFGLGFLLKKYIFWELSNAISALNFW
jgi:hypothetical protein